MTRLSRLPMALALAADTAIAEERPAFLGSETCVACHEDAAAKWEG